MSKRSIKEILIKAFKKEISIYFSKFFLDHINKLKFIFLTKLTKKSCFTILIQKYYKWGRRGFNMNQKTI